LLSSALPKAAEFVPPPPKSELNNPPCKGGFVVYAGLGYSPNANRDFPVIDPEGYSFVVDG